MKTPTFPCDPNTLAAIAEQAGAAAGEPFPRQTDRSKGDGVTTCLFHRAHEWTMKYYAPLLPVCSVCGGACDPRLSAHHLCVERQKRNLPTPQLDSTPRCACAKCAAKQN